MFATPDDGARFYETFPGGKDPAGQAYSHTVQVEVQQETSTWIAQNRASVNTEMGDLRSKLSKLLDALSP